jgi:glycosyltransferase involved in cell wall biosynthesis
VKFLGQRNDIADQIAQSTIMVQCSETEGMPYTVLEAMAGGRPVIGTKVEGVVDLINDGQNGRLYPRGDYQQLAEQLTGLLTQPALAKRMGRAGRQLVEQEYSLTTMIERIEKLYRE